MPLTETNIIQKFVGKFLYYGLAIDNTILVALNNISLEQSSATKNTSKKVAILLNDLNTNPNASIQYHTSGMILYVHSDASYMSIKKPRSRTGGIHFLSDARPESTYYKTILPLMNVIIHVVCKILRNFMASSAEAELGLLLVNAQDASPIRTTLIEMNHPQPPTPIQVDNSTAVGIANEAIKHGMSNAMDMRFYWIWCRINQDQFIVYWKPGKDNLGDYPTKNHSPAHNIMVRPVYLHGPKCAKVTLQGCVNSAISAHT